MPTPPSTASPSSPFLIVSGNTRAMIDGATMRCVHAAGCPAASSPACSTWQLAGRYWAFRMSSSRDRSEEHTSELQSRLHLVCRLLLEKKKTSNIHSYVSDDAPLCAASRDRLITGILVAVILTRMKRRQGYSHQ